MTTSGGTCWTFETLNNNGSEYRITSSEGSVEVRFPKARELTLVCPDGSRYGGNVDTLFNECGSVPGIYTISDHDVGIAMFAGDGQPLDSTTDLPLIGCD